MKILVEFFWEVVQKRTTPPGGTFRKAIAKRPCPGPYVGGPSAVARAPPPRALASWPRDTAAICINDSDIVEVAAPLASS